jgi:translation initiation factor IF-3
MAFTPHGNGGYRPKPSPTPRPRGARPADNANANKAQHRINEYIRGVKEVRLVGDNVQMGIYPIQEALRIAEGQELDLVEISPNAVPPVCKVIDYQKFCYQQKKKAKEAKANSAKMVVKEIRFGPQTDDHDYNFKLRHAKEFLQEGSKVKAYVFFKGRQIVFKDQGTALLARFANDLEDVGKPDSFPPVLEGKRMIMMMSPKTGARKADKPAEAGEANGKSNDNE